MVTALRCAGPAAVASVEAAWQRDDAHAHEVWNFEAMASLLRIPETMLGILAFPTHDHPAHVQLIILRERGEEGGM